MSIINLDFLFFKYFRGANDNDQLWIETEHNDEERMKKLVGKKKKKKKKKQNPRSTKQCSDLEGPKVPIRSSSLVKNVQLATMAVRWKQKTKLRIIEEHSATDFSSFPPPPSFLLANTPLAPTPPSRTTSLKKAIIGATAAVRWKRKTKQSTTIDQLPPPPAILLFPHSTYQSFQDEECLPGCPVDCNIAKMTAFTPRP